MTNGRTGEQRSCHSCRPWSTEPGRRAGYKRQVMPTAVNQARAVGTMDLGCRGTQRRWCMGGAEHNYLESRTEKQLEVQNALPRDFSTSRAPAGHVPWPIGDPAAGSVRPATRKPLKAVGPPRFQVASTALFEFESWDRRRSCIVHTVLHKNTIDCERQSALCMGKWAIAPSPLCSTPLHTALGIPANSKPH